MLHMHDTSMYFRAEVISTTHYIANRVFLRPRMDKTSYELWLGRKPPNLKYFKFLAECYILRDGENLGKFDPKSNLGIFLGYSTKSKAYKVYH